MSDNFEKLDQIYFSVRKLINRNQALQHENEELQHQLKELNDCLCAEQKRVQELEQQLKMLKLARQIKSGDPADENQKELRNKIDAYIREIDQCIAMLKSE